MEQNKKLFSGLEEGKVYMLEIDEDPVELAKEKNVGYVAQKPEKSNQNKKGVDNITSELKNMSIDELKEKGEKYK